LLLIKNLPRNGGKNRKSADKFGDVVDYMQFATAVTVTAVTKS
jgi:hypothetical protein